MTKLMRNMAMAAGLALASGLSAPAWAEFPTRAMTIVVPFSPGGGTDTLSRLVAERLTDRFGVPVVVENRPGGNTLVGVNHVLQAEPDGHTFMTTINATMVINPHLYADLPYDPLEDFIPVSIAVSMPLVMSVHPDSPVDSLAELRQAVADGTIDGSYAHGALPGKVMMTMMADALGLDLNPIPYKGSSQSTQAVMGGHVPILIDGLAPSLPMIQGGTLKPLAVTSLERSPILPDVPAVREATETEVGADSWTGFFLPANAPEEAVTTLEQAFQDLLADPDFRKRLESLGYAVDAQGIAESRERIARESAQYEEVIRNAGIQVE